jgi:hypothetical protein
VVSVRPFFGVEMLPGPVSSRTYKCWISKAASYTLAGDTRPQNPALLNGEGYKTPFAFTSLEMESPHIIIDLGRTYRVDEIQVENRADAPKNISLLTAWISADGREWEKIGYTDNFQTQWSVMLGQTPKARYVKIGFSGKSVLQLRQVKIFGADQPDFFSWINNISRSLRTK